MARIASTNKSSNTLPDTEGSTFHLVMFLKEVGGIRPAHRKSVYLNFAAWKLQLRSFAGMNCLR